MSHVLSTLIIPFLGTALLCLAACKKEPVSAIDNGTWNLGPNKNTAIKPGDKLYIAPENRIHIW